MNAWRKPLLHSTQRADFDEDEPRNQNGQWTTGGGSGSGSSEKGGQSAASRFYMGLKKFRDKIDKALGESEPKNKPIDWSGIRPSAGAGGILSQLK